MKKKLLGLILMLAVTTQSTQAFNPFLVVTVPVCFITEVALVTAIGGASVIAGGVMLEIISKQRNNQTVAAYVRNEAAFNATLFLIAAYSGLAAYALMPHCS